jgi:hypothetical protein
LTLLRLAALRGGKLSGNLKRAAVLVPETNDGELAASINADCVTPLVLYPPGLPFPVL